MVIFFIYQKIYLSDRVPLRHTYFFSNFGWGDPSQHGSWYEGFVKPLKLCRVAIWQVSEDPYHTEFVSWHVIGAQTAFTNDEEGGMLKRKRKIMRQIVANTLLIVVHLNGDRMQHQALVPKRANLFASFYLLKVIKYSENPNLILQDKTRSMSSI